VSFLLLLLLLIKALYLQGSFGLLNKFFPFGPVSDAVPPVCYFHICYVTLYIILPHILGLPSDLVSAGDHSYTFFYHAIVCHTVYMTKPG